MRPSGPVAPRALRPPHVDRLTARVRALDGPLVQLWAWPGMGQQAVLDALTEDARFGQPLSLEDIADEASLARAVAAAFESGARWLVLPAVPSLPASVPASAGAIARLLAPRQRLVFAAPERRPPGPLACSYLLPEELLLARDEIAALWRAVTGAEPSAELVERLARSTDGWYRPLRLVAEAAAEAAGSVDPGTLLDQPGVAAFLRHEVLGGLSPEERELLVELSAADSLQPGLWTGILAPAEEALRRRLVEVWGLGLEAEGRLRLPYLLRWFLARERLARWPAARRRELAARLAAAELTADRPIKALEHLVEAERPDEAAALLEERWAELAATVPLGLFGRLFERFGTLGKGEPFRGSSLLRLLAEALLWRRESALGELARRCAEEGELGRACELLAPLLVPGADPDDEGGPDPSRLPPELRPLGVLLALRPPEGDESEVDLAAEAARLVPALARVPPGGPRPAGLEGIHMLSPLQALFGGALADLLHRRPLLAAELRGRRDLPVPWRRWLAGLPPAGLAGEAAGYAVSLLGHPAVRLRRPDGTAQDLAFKLRRGFEVFAFLATSAGFAATQEEIRRAVWEDDDEETVAKNFHPTLSHLRRSLAPGGDGPSPVVLRRGVYRLNPRLAWSVDAVELVRRADEGRERMREGQPEQAAELWRSAWGLYGGPLLVGWDSRWIAERREALARRYLELLRDLGEVAERLGRWTEAMDAYRAALIEDPLQEPLHLGLMRVYSRQGRRDHVRRQYERLVALLREELNAEPLEETAEIYRRLMG